MMNWSVIFLMAALVSGLFAVSDSAGSSADVAEFLVFFFLAVPAVTFVLRAVRAQADDDDDLGRN
jgi:uncharacterized membrane protein YtjA (UPF0391 family)